MNFSMDQLFEVNAPMVLSETIDDETVIINLSSGVYYSLKSSGSTMWAAIEQSASPAHIATLVHSRFEGDSQDIEREIASLIDQLAEEDLIRPCANDGDISFASVPVGDGQPSPFVAPTLDKFTDMEALLLLDPVHDVNEAGWPNLPEA